MTQTPSTSGSQSEAELLRAETLVLALTQISGATAAISAHGDAATLNVARAANAVVRGAVERAGGRIIKALGEGLLLTFPVERARDAVRELQAARDQATATWRAFEPGSEMHVTATVGTVLVGDLGLATERTSDVWGLTVHTLFKERANGLVLLPALRALIDTPADAV